MDGIIEQIKNIPLFLGIRNEDLAPMLACLGNTVRSYHKGEYIFLSEEPVKSIGIILQGTVHMVKEDLWGNKTILAFMSKGELFGETFVCSGSYASTVSFLCSEQCRVLFLPFSKVLHHCTRECVFHHRLIENMVLFIANKNMMLMEKIEIISKKTLRERILTYLSLQAHLSGQYAFEIPLGRLELADYLCADRSALTRELNRMKKDGIISFEKNTFRLMNK